MRIITLTQKKVRSWRKVLQTRGIEFLPGELVFRDHRAGVALFAIRAIGLVCRHCAGGIGFEDGTAQVIGVQVCEGCTYFHRNALAAEVIVLGGSTACHFIEPIDIPGVNTAAGLADARAVRVVKIALGGQAAAGDATELGFVVPGEGLRGGKLFVARCHVAVGVVVVAVSCADLVDRMFVGGVKDLGGATGYD